MEDQRWHLEEQAPFLEHEVGVHPKQQYCAKQEGKKINELINKNTRVNVVMHCRTLPQIQVEANI